MKKSLLLIALGFAAVMPAQAQWTHYDTQTTINGVLGVLNHSIESAERKKQMEIYAKEKAQYEQSFKDAMESAKDYETGEYWEDALIKYEEAAKLNCKYGYTDQMQITRKITGLYAKAGREDDGPSVLNNAKTILPDYSARCFFCRATRSDCKATALSSNFINEAARLRKASFDARRSSAGS